MASEKLQKILAMSQNMDKKGKSTAQRQSHMPQMRRAVGLNEQIATANKTIANIDAQFNSPYVPTKEETEAWNTERGREELTQLADKKVFEERIKHSKLPPAILESMRLNPCNYDPSVVNTMMGPENELFKKLNEAYGKQKEEPVRGVKAIHQINEQLENRDKQMLDENKTSISDDNTNGKITNGLTREELKSIVEEVIDAKLNTTNNLKVMMLTSNGNFRFLDNEDNVYECEMKYIGKRKKKK